MFATDLETLDFGAIKVDPQIAIKVETPDSNSNYFPPTPYTETPPLSDSNSNYVPPPPSETPSDSDSDDDDDTSQQSQTDTKTRNTSIKKYIQGLVNKTPSSDSIMNYLKSLLLPSDDVVADPSLYQTPIWDSKKIKNPVRWFHLVYFLDKQRIIYTSFEGKHNEHKTKKTGLMTKEIKEMTVRKNNENRIRFALIIKACVEIFDSLVASAPRVFPITDTEFNDLHIPTKGKRERGRPKNSKPEIDSRSTSDISMRKKLLMETLLTSQGNASLDIDFVRDSTINDITNGLLFLHDENSYKLQRLMKTNYQSLSNFLSPQLFKAYFDRITICRQYDAYINSFTELNNNNGVLQSAEQTGVSLEWMDSIINGKNGNPHRTREDVVYAAFQSEVIKIYTEFWNSESYIKYPYKRFLTTGPHIELIPPPPVTSTYLVKFQLPEPRTRYGIPQIFMWCDFGLSSINTFDPSVPNEMPSYFIFCDHHDPSQGERFREPMKQALVDAMENWKDGFSGLKIAPTYSGNDHPHNYTAVDAGSMLQYYRIVNSMDLSEGNVIKNTDQIKKEKLDNMATYLYRLEKDPGYTTHTIEGEELPPGVWLWDGKQKKSTTDTMLGFNPLLESKIQTGERTYYAVKSENAASLTPAVDCFVTFNWSSAPIIINKGQNQKKDVQLMEGQAGISIFFSLMPNRRRGAFTAKLGDINITQQTPERKLIYEKDRQHYILKGSPQLDENKINKIGKNWWHRQLWLDVICNPIKMDAATYTSQWDGAAAQWLHLIFKGIADQLYIDEKESASTLLILSLNRIKLFGLCPENVLVFLLRKFLDFSVCQPKEAVANEDQKGEVRRPIFQYNTSEVCASDTEGNLNWLAPDQVYGHDFMMGDCSMVYSIVKDGKVVHYKMNVDTTDVLLIRPMPTSQEFWRIYRYFMNTYFNRFFQTQPDPNIHKNQIANLWDWLSNSTQDKLITSSLSSADIVGSKEFKSYGAALLSRGINLIPQNSERPPFANDTWTRKRKMIKEKCFADRKGPDVVRFDPKVPHVPYLGNDYPVTSLIPQGFVHSSKITESKILPSKIWTNNQGPNKEVLTLTQKTELRSLLQEGDWNQVVDYCTRIINNPGYNIETSSKKWLSKMDILACNIPNPLPISIVKNLDSDLDNELLDMLYNLRLCLIQMDKKIEEVEAKQQKTFEHIKTIQKYLKINEPTLREIRNKTKTMEFKLSLEAEKVKNDVLKIMGIYNDKSLGLHYKRLAYFNIMMKKVAAARKKLYQFIVNLMLSKMTKRNNQFQKIDTLYVFPPGPSCLIDIHSPDIIPIYDLITPVNGLYTNNPIFRAIIVALEKEANVFYHVDVIAYLKQLKDTEAGLISPNQFGKWGDGKKESYSVISFIFNNVKELETERDKNAGELQIELHNFTASLLPLKSSLLPLDIPAFEKSPTAQILTIEEMLHSMKKVTQFLPTPLLEIRVSPYVPKVLSENLKVWLPEYTLESLYSIVTTITDQKSPDLKSDQDPDTISDSIVFGNISTQPNDPDFAALLAATGYLKYTSLPVLPDESYTTSELRELDNMIEL